jgi:hypothetical protein
VITNAGPDRRNVLLAATTFTVVSTLGGTTSNASAETSSLNPQPLPPSPGWARAMPTAPDARVKITEEYAKHVARDVYFWAWPMANIYNRRLAYKGVPEIMMSGPAPIAPLNRLGMLTDYIDPSERLVACPNQDVVYGAGSVALDQSAVVVQVPDFGDRFWVYQVVDLRTDSFVQLGKMYGTTPGFYLLVGPEWHGDVPKGITKLFRSSTNTGFIAPRIFQDDTPEDKKAIQGVLQQVMMYPLVEYDGPMKSMDWHAIKQVPASASGEEETKWVVPERFFQELPAVLADALPLPGEEARYAQVMAVLAAAKDNPSLMAAMISAAKEADEKLVTPLFQFRNYGQQLPFNWSTIFERGGVRRRLLHANSSREIQHPGELAAGDEVLLPGPRRVGQPSERYQSLYGHFCEGADSAGQWVLVAHALQRIPLLRAQRPEAIFRRHQEQDAQTQRGRITYDLCTG